MQFTTIFMDLPWDFEVWNKATGSGRSAASHYATMTLDQIKAIGPGIHAIAAPNAALCMWACRPSQDDAFEVVKHWNRLVNPENKRKLRKFEWRYITEVFTWVKTNKDGSPKMGMGYWSRANTEPVFLFTRGKISRLAKNVPQVIMAPLRKMETKDFRGVVSTHSVKPEEAQDRAERLLPGPYAELFARRHRPNWRCLGWELDGLDINDSLAALAAEESETP